MKLAVTSRAKYYKEAWNNNFLIGGNKLDVFPSGIEVASNLLSRQVDHIEANEEKTCLKKHSRLAIFQGRGKSEGSDLNDFDFSVWDDVSVGFGVGDAFLELVENLVDVDQKQFRNPNFRQVVFEQDGADQVDVGLTRNFTWNSGKAESESGATGMKTSKHEL